MQSISSVLQEGLLVNRTWLKKSGFDRPAVDYFLRSGKLEAVTHGIYRKPGPPLKWQNVVYSLQLLNYKVHVGHMSSLKYYGYQHYLAIGETSEITLYSANELPSWLYRLKDFSFKHMNRSPFPPNCRLGLQEISFGTWDWPIPYSTPERAFIELISTINNENGINQARTMFEGAISLRPLLVQDLLEACIQIKAKRLFLWLARTLKHPWYKHINIGMINLGKGKRQIVPNGALDKEFQITVPKEVEGEQIEPIF